MASTPSPDDGPITRVSSSQVSLPEVHGSVPVPTGAGFWKKMLAFAGPGYLVAVGYMDPGQLGHRHRRRRPVRLCPAVRGVRLQSPGHPAPGARRAAWHRQWPRPRAGVPRPVLAPHHDLPVDPRRDCDRRHRPRRGDRVGDRAGAALRSAQGGRRLRHVGRRADRAGPAAAQVPLRRGCLSSC